MKNNRQRFQANWISQRFQRIMQTASKPRRRRALQFEQLEGRKLLAVVLQQNFSGLDFDETSCNCTPPDTQMAVGPNSVIGGVNTAFMIQDKTGGIIAGPLEGNTFFASVLRPGQTYQGDPQTVYDDQANRFYMVGFELNAAFTTGSLDLAVSKTSNPTTLTAADWHFYRFDSVNEGDTQFPDFPKLGFNNDALFVSFNQFAGGTTFSHGLMLVIDKASVLSGGPSTSFASIVEGGFKILIPARMHNQPTGNLEYLVRRESNTLNTVEVVKMTNYLTATPTFVETTITVNDYDQSPGVPGLTNNIDDRMLSASWVDDMLVASHNVGVGGLNLSRWYEFNAPLAGTPTLVQQGDIGPGPGISTSYPSIAVNPAGDIALTYMQNSSSEPTSMYVTGRTAAQTAGFMPPGRLVKAGVAVAPGVRGGDYSATEYDPSAPSSFWSANQYHLGPAASNFRWGTQIAKYTLTTAPFVVSSTPTGAQTTPVSSITITFDEPMNTASFSVAADVVSFTGPTGNLKPLITTASFNGAGTVLTINFPAQAVPGSYSLVLGPQILSTAAGVALDNNGNGTAGESPADNFNATFSIISVVCENFDSVTAPALPAGWSTESVSGAINWATTTTTSFSLPNNAFIPDIDIVSDTRLIGPAFTYTAGNNQVQFRNNFDSEQGFDGGVLEISINGAAFQDILTAGGLFVTGGYTRALNTGFGNPLPGRQAWSGSSGGYILTTVNLPAAAAGQPVQLRWRFGSDNIVADVGWHIDDVCVPVLPTTLAIAATSADKAEGSALDTSFTFTVTRAGNVSGATTVNFAVTGSGGNPANAADFDPAVLPNGSVSFAATETSKVVTVIVNGDTTVEPDETFLVTLSGASGGAIINTPTATGTIRNDDRALAIAATSADKAEGNAGPTAFTFTVTRSGLTTGATTVNFAVTGTGASPANAVDFTGAVLPSGSVSFADTETSKVVTVNVNGDTSVESDDTFLVTLSGASNASITTPTATGTIRNDDAAATTLAIAATSADKAEGNAGNTPFTFTVTRGGNVSGATTVNFAVTGNGANPANAADFAGAVLPNGAVSFAATETSKVITVNVNGDNAVELAETFLVTLSGASGGASITTSTATGTIRNDDTALAIAATSADKAEGSAGPTPFTFTVTRSGNTAGTTTVNFAVTGTGGTPANAADFTGAVLPSGTVSFAPTETSKVVTVNVNGDTAVESDDTFLVTLAGASGGASITTPTATGTIRNDDSSLVIAATSADKAEGNAASTPFTFTVTRTGNTAGTTTVNFAVTGSGANPANAADFDGAVLPSGTVSFAPTETSKVVTVNVNGDTTVELDETFLVTLSAPSGGATISTASATGTIRNDDAAATTLAIAALSANKVEGNAGPTPFTFTVTRGGNTTGGTTVNFAVTGNGATPANAADFTGGVLPSGVVTFIANETSKDITVNVNGDAAVEPNETFRVTLSGATGGALINTATADGTILNDDAIVGQLALACNALHVGVNTCTISGATPGGVVGLVIGTQAGATPIPSLGITLGILSPTFVAQGVVGANGQATMQFNIAASFVGQTILVQGYEQAPQPRVSNVFSQTVTQGPTLSAAGAAGTNPNAAGLRASEADAILKAARAMWALSGVTTAESQLLQQTTLQVVDLAGNALGRRAGTTIIVDANAADFGWFVDATPGATEEFVRRRTRPGQPFRERELFARENGPAHQRMDLLTVVLHEMGQVIGRSSTNMPIPLMDGTLALGVRELPPGAADAFFAQL